MVLHNNNSLLNINSSSLLVTDFSFLQQPPYFHHLRSLYHIFATLTCLLGNTIVLVASYKYNSFNIDTSSLALLQNLAVADITLGVLREVPTLVSGLMRRWVFGLELCWSLGIFYWMPQVVETLTVSLISISRCYKLVFPRRPPILSSLRSTRAVCAGMWGIAAVSVTINIVFKLPVKFDVMASTCTLYHDHNFTMGSSARIIWLTSTALFFSLPCLLILSTNLAMLGIATRYRFRRTGHVLPSAHAFLTVSLVAWGFLLSMLPAVGSVVVATFTPIPPWYNVLVWEFLTINIWVNPVIYTFINVKFRRFVTRRFCRGPVCGSAAAAAR